MRPRNISMMSTWSDATLLGLGKVESSQFEDEKSHRTLQSAGH
jgi:hypothetical protein